MSIDSKITLNTHYTRSVNIERDASSEDIVNAYIPTSRAVRTLERIVDTFGEKQAPRAWSLIGPYGSGKSTFSIFLSHLLGDPNEKATTAAYRVLKDNKNIVAKCKNQTKRTHGYFKVMLSGSPEPLAGRLLTSIHNSAQLFWKDLKGAKPKVLGKLKKAASSSDGLSPNEILTLISELQDALEGKSKGILLMIDELGKFLEYEARHYGVNDIFLLQLLAEHACSNQKVNLYLFAMLHQSFEQYAKGLGEALKKEWSKIQGRFEDIPFLEGPEQTLRVVSKAIDQSFTSKELEKISSKNKKVITALDKEKSLPGVLSKEDASKLFNSCYPLHPITALLLPMLCQKIAQNERTLFSFLGSNEPKGFKNVITQLKDVGEYVMPHHVFDYFIMNQPASIGDHLTHRRWVEVITAIDRVGDIPQNELELLKTIGLLNIIGAQAGFKASNVLLGTLYSKPTLAKYIQDLESKSVIQYRKFSSEYRVWQGSDFDIELALHQELANLGKFSLSKILNQRANLQPVVARRYTIESGTLRYFKPVFVDAESYLELSKNDSQPRIIFYLSLGKDDEAVFKKQVIHHFGELDIIALCKNAESLRDAVSEVEAMHKVKISRQELNSDPVASREYYDRLDAAELSEQTLLRDLIDSPQENYWFWSASTLKVRNKRELQGQLSSVLRSIYHSAPIILNELINRDKPSTQAVAARGKLLQALLINEHKEGLGIEKNPPEKAIYNSLIKATGIHSEISGKWQITEPSLDGRKHRVTQFHKVWALLKDFIVSSEKSSRSFSELDTVLVSPPYGVKAGLLPIIYTCAYLVYKDVIALYENRRFIPKLSTEQLERFIKRPDEFDIQYFKIDGFKKSVFSELNIGLFDTKGSKNASSKQRTVLDIARPLATFMRDLPDYTQKTKQLSKQALALRSAFNLSKSPVKLIFEELPKALGFTINSDSSFEGLSNKLMETLQELKYAHVKLKERQTSLLANALRVPNYESMDELDELRSNVSGKVCGLENYTVDVSGVKAFLRRLTNKSDSNDSWLDNIFMFLGHKPLEKWSDSDQSQAEYKLAQLGQQIVDLHKLWVQYGGPNSDKADFDVILLRAIKKGQDQVNEVDSIVTISKETSLAVREAKEEVFNILRNIKDNELKLATIAEIVNDFLLENNDQNEESHSDTPNLKNIKES